MSLDHALAAVKAALPVLVPILIALLPSVITALTPYPQAAGVVRYLKLGLNLLSLLTHYDSPGTLKAPLTVSAPPPGQPPVAGEISAASQR